MPVPERSTGREKTLNARRTGRRLEVYPWWRDGFGTEWGQQETLLAARTPFILRGCKSQENKCRFPRDFRDAKSSLKAALDIDTRLIRVACYRFS